jgi:hypothetical protein
MATGEAPQNQPHSTLHRPKTHRDHTRRAHRPPTLSTPHCRQRSSWLKEAPRDGRQAAGGGESDHLLLHSIPTTDSYHREAPDPDPLPARDHLLSRLKFRPEIRVIRRHPWRRAGRQRINHSIHPYIQTRPSQPSPSPTSHYLQSPQTQRPPLARTNHFSHLHGSSFILGKLPKPLIPLQNQLRLRPEPIQAPSKAF